MLTLAQCFSQVQLFAIPKTVARQAPLSVRLSWTEYWRGHHFLLQEISTQAWKPKFLWLVHWQADSLPLILTYIFPTISIPLQFNTCNSDNCTPPVLLLWKSHGPRSLVGCSPWCREESGMTEQLPFHFSLWCIGEGNGNPTPVFLPGESQGWGSLVGCCLWGLTESDTTEVT